MMKRSVSISIAIAAIIIVALVAYFVGTSKKETTTETMQTPTTTAPSTTAPTGTMPTNTMPPAGSDETSSQPNTQAPTSDANPVYAMADVAKHSTPADCWIVIEGGVYNMSGFSDVHPGGPNPIESSCGKDATTTFETKGGSGMTHSDRAKAELATHKIGTVAATNN